MLANNLSQSSCKAQGVERFQPTACPTKLLLEVPPKDYARTDTPRKTLQCAPGLKLKSQGSEFASDYLCFWDWEDFLKKQHADDLQRVK